MNYICLFLPALVAVLIYEKITDRNIDVVNAILYYGLFNVLNNMIVFSVIYYIFNDSIINFSLAFCIKSLFLSLLNCIILPFIIISFEKNIKIRVRLNVKKKK